LDTKPKGLKIFYELSVLCLYLLVGLRQSFVELL
jgi:hypothetical protein